MPYILYPISYIPRESQDFARVGISLSRPKLETDAEELSIVLPHSVPFSHVLGDCHQPFGVLRQALSHGQLSELQGRPAVPTHRILLTRCRMQDSWFLNSASCRGPMSIGF